MKTCITGFLALALTGFIAGCSNSSGSGNSSTNAATVAPLDCPAGSTFTTSTAYPSGACVTATGAVVNPIGTTAAAGTYGYYTDNWDGQNLMTITNSNSWTDFLEEAFGVCSDSNSCSTWANSPFDIVVQASSPTVYTVTFRTRPPYANTAPVGFTLNMQVSPINSSQGFEAQSYGPQGTPAYEYLLQLQVAVGQYGTTGSMTYQLDYNGAEMAQGTLNSCNTAQCGLSSNIGNY